MISFTVRMTFRTDDRDEIVQILRELTRLSRQEDGCVSYIPHFVESDPDTILIYEQYRDEAAARAPSCHTALRQICRRRPLPEDARTLNGEPHCHLPDTTLLHAPPVASKPRMDGETRCRFTRSSTNALTWLQIPV